LNWEQPDQVTVYLDAENELVIVGDMCFDYDEARGLAIAILEAVEQADSETQQVLTQLGMGLI